MGVQRHGPVFRVALAHRDQAAVGVDAGAHAGLADVQRLVGSSRVQELQGVSRRPAAIRDADRKTRRLGQPRHETIEPQRRMPARAPGPPSGTPERSPDHRRQAARGVDVGIPHPPAGAAARRRRDRAGPHRLRAQRQGGDRGAESGLPGDDLDPVPAGGRGREDALGRPGGVRAQGRVPRRGAGPLRGPHPGRGPGRQGQRRGDRRTARRPGRPRRRPAAHRPERPHPGAVGPRLPPRLPGARQGRRRHARVHPLGAGQLPDDRPQGGRRPVALRRRREQPHLRAADCLGAAHPAAGGLPAARLPSW